jgi:spermidine synthase
MSRFFKYRTQKEASIELSEQDGVRSLHLGGTMIQSAMKVSAPNNLELAYTRYMMGFLLFQACPERILMIGLGGGSLAKFAFHNLPQTKITAIEVNAQIVATAYNHFSLPADQERLQIIVAEGGEYLANHTESTDVLMVDGFDDDCQVSSLCSQDFYDLAYKVLTKNGVLIINLLSQDKGRRDYLQRIEKSFNGHVISMLSEKRGNLIVFAFKRSPGKLAWKALKSHAKVLEKEYDLPFSEFLEKLRKYNSNNNFLEI